MDLLVSKRNKGQTVTCGVCGAELPYKTTTIVVCTYLSETTCVTHGLLVFQNVLLQKPSPSISSRYRYRALKCMPSSMIDIGSYKAGPFSEMTMHTDKGSIPIDVARFE